MTSAPKMYVAMDVHKDTVMLGATPFSWTGERFRFHASSTISFS